MRPRGFLGPVELTRKSPVENVIHQGRLTASGDTRHHGEKTNRKADREVLEIILRGIGHGEPTGPRRGFHRGALADPGNRYFGRSREELPGQGSWIGKYLGRRSDRHDLTSPRSRAGPHVENMVCGKDRLLIMFDDNHRVSQITKPPKCSEQAVVITLMKADARLIEHIEDTGQSRSDLRGKTDTLRLTAGERSALTIEREVTQAHLDKESQPRADLPDKITRDLPISLRELQSGKNLACTGCRKRAELLNIPFPVLRSGECDPEDFRTQSCTPAGGARLS